MITDREDTNSYMIDFNDHEDWNGFDYIISRLKDELNAKVLQQNDGPDARVWHLEVEGVLLSLHNNPYGNYIKASSPTSIIYLKNTINKLKSIF